MCRQFLDEYKGQLLQNLWTDISMVNSQAEERLDYATQKPEALLDRISILQAIQARLSPISLAVAVSQRRWFISWDGGLSIETLASTLSRLPATG